jgi:hypothetical protein
MTSAIEKRLAALERIIIARPPVLIFVWTKSLADRIAPLVPQDRNIKLVHMGGVPGGDEAFEADLRDSNPTEAARLDALLRGEFPPDRYPTNTQDSIGLA